MSDKNPPPNKKRKLESNSKFTSAEQVRQSIRSQNPDVVVEALNQLRNQLTIRSEEGKVSPQDERLNLVEQWLAKDPGAQDVFEIWKNANSKQSNLLVAVVAVLGVVITLLSSHYTYHAIGHPIVKSLLSSQWMRRLNSYIGGAHNELILVTLKLLNAISAFAGGREKKMLLEAFQWEIKSLPKLLTLRRKGKVDYNPLSRPDIRTLYILLLLSFLDGQTQVKTTFLEQHRDAFLAVFKGLSQDHYLFIRHVLETIWTNLWSDPKVKRTIKVGLFNESSISHLLKIYERTSSDDEDPEHIPADLVHHFFLAIMTRPGFGICFKDKGWYPRDDTDDERGSKIHNKILGNILKVLKVNEDSRQQELARKIFEACPELVAGYWSSAQLTLEPRLSTKWIANISFFGTIISLPVPQSSFYLPGTDLFNPIPPPLQSVLSNIVPSDISPKNVFTKGLLSQSGLVQHCTAQALAKCLNKFANVLDIFQVVETALEGKDTEDGLWAKRRKEIQKEFRRRVPEFQVVLGFSQQKPPVSATAGGQVVSASVKAHNPVRNALLQESAQRLLLLYHQYLPEAVSEARFDVGKVLVNFDTPTEDVDGSGDDVPDAAKKLHLVQRLHVIRTLKESDQFVWTNKTSSSRTYLYAILKSYTTASVPALKSVLLGLLTHLFSTNILFERTPSEPLLWFTSLSNFPRASDAKSPDNATLANESESVVTFLDDCIQRCFKTPYRYIEEMYNIQISPPDSLAEIYPSPLVMTLVEQLDAKIRGGLVTPSDVLAISSFIRKLIFRLTGQVRHLTFLEAFVIRMDQTLSEDRLWASEYPLMTAAVRTEVQMMYAVVQPTRAFDVLVESNQSLNSFLDAIEDGVSTGQEHEQISLAYSIIDQLRFSNQPLSFPDTKRVILAIQTRWAPTLQTLAQHLFPWRGSWWLNRVIVGTDVGETIPIEWVLYNTSMDQILDPDYRTSFVAALFSVKPNLQSCIRLITHLEHVLNPADARNAQGLLSLLALFLTEAQSNLTDNDMVELKEILFIHPSSFKRLAMSHEVDDQVYMGLRAVIQSSFDPLSSTDTRVLSEISAHWAALLQNRLTLAGCNLNLAALWTKYLPSAQSFSLLDQLMSQDISSQNSVFIPLVESLLDGIRASTSDDLDIKNSLWERIPQLLRIRHLLRGSPIAEELILIAINTTLPVGLQAAVDHNHLVPLCIEMQQARSCWSRRFLRPDDFSIYDFVTSDHWTPSTAKIISSLIYKQGLDVSRFETWLRSDHSSSRSYEDLATVIHAALDVYQLTSQENSSLNSAAWISHLKIIGSLCFDQDHDQRLCRTAISCVVMAHSIFCDYQQELAQHLLKHAERRRHENSPPLASIQLGIHIPELTIPLLDWSLHWVIGKLADGAVFDNHTQGCIEAITSLVHVSTPKVHQVETLLGVVIQHHVHRPSALELANACISKTTLKPVSVNRYLQSILHHPQFIKLTGGANSNTEVRPKIIRILHTLFNLHPANTCQVTQIQPLLRVYGGTLSREDLLVFSIFQLFEIQRKISLESLFSCWSSSHDITCSSAWESLQTLDPGRIFQTTLHYPNWRKLNAEFTSRKDHDCQHYDPVFLLILHHLVLTQNPPTTALAWIELFRTNIVGLCIRTLSSKDPAMRAFGISQLSALHKSVENLMFQEKLHVTYIFSLLKDLLPRPSSDEPPPRLATYTTLMLSHALRGIFYPSNSIYPLTARFLLQRPEFDAGDVPMLYAMLYSNTDEWKKERGWIIRFLADGMVSSTDWRVLKRRRAWDLLASLFEGSRTDSALRKGVFEVLASLTSNQQAVTSMIFTSSFLPWLEMQILQVQVDESLKWARVLSNIVLTVDHAKLDAALNASWRTCIYRCLSTLLRKSDADLILPVATVAMFRLGLSTDTIGSEATECISRASCALERIETYLHVTDGMNNSTDDQPYPRLVLYHSQSINEPVVRPHSHIVWFECLTLLWRTIMASAYKQLPLDEFTFKLLASCSRMGLESAEMRWIRKEVVLLQGIYT